MTKKAFSNPCSIKNTLFVVCIFILIGSGRGYGQRQPHQINGIVISANDGKPLEGATVKLKSGRVGMLTGKDGSFNFTTPINKGTLVVTFVGYQTQEVDFSSVSKLPIIIKLAGEGNELEEVEVSTGYQQIPKERATGSFVHIDSALLNRNPSASILDRLKGVTNGLMVVNGGDVTSGNGQGNITIRGLSSINANKDPLIVLDNFPYSGDINLIDPKTIASVTVLKDAAAASIWGTRAGNGVIVITTKKGIYSQPLRIDASASLQLKARPDLYDAPLLAPTSQVQLEEFLFSKGYFTADETSPAHPALSPAVELMIGARDGKLANAALRAGLDSMGRHDIRSDLETYLYQPATQQQYGMSMQGGGQRMNYVLTARYNFLAAAEKGNQSGQFSVGPSLTFQFTPKLEVFVNTQISQLYGAQNAPVFLQGNLIKGLLYAHLADDSGNGMPVMLGYRAPFIEQLEQQGLLNWQYNPLQELREQDHQHKERYTRLHTGARYLLATGLSLSATYQLENQLTQNQLHDNVNTYYARDLINRFTRQNSAGLTEYPLPYGDILRISQDELTAQSGRLQLNYDRVSGPHTFSTLAGTELRQVKVDGSRDGFYGYDSELGMVNSLVNYDQLYTFSYYPAASGRIPVLGGSLPGTLNRYGSYFANGSYSYSERYTLSLSGRVDQSNFFGVKANMRLVPLWSAGLAWDISQEKCYNISWLPYLKLRATYGHNGNTANTTAFLTARYASSSEGLGSPRYAKIVTPPNPQLRWEKVKMYNAGLDFAAISKRITGSLEYYHKNGDDLIADGLLDPTTGFSSFTGNVADMQGQGIDLEIRTVNLKGAFSWQSTLQFSYNTDRVTKYFQNLTSYTSLLSTVGPFAVSTTAGRPVNSIFSYRWAGLDPATGDPMGYLADGTPTNNYLAVMSVANTSLDELYNGPARPKWFGSFRHTIDYQNISVSVNVSYKLGYYFRRSGLQYGTLFSASSPHADYSARWQQPGDERNTNIPSLVYPAVAIRDQFYQTVAVLIEKGDHIRLQDVQVDYTFKNPLFRNASQLQVYGYAENLGILWRANHRGIDPDSPLSPQLGSYVSPFALTVGLKANF